MVIKAVGFDFDGTLIMSEDKKGKQMAEVFKEKFNVKRGVKKAYEEMIGKGLNRDEKVKKLFEHFLKRKPSKKELNMVADHFGVHYAKGLASCPLFQCTNIVKELRSQVKFLFLLSLENTKEVKKVAKHCGVAKYFDEILGGPTSKIANLEHVLNKHGVKRSEVIYIGDAHSDVVATKRLKMKVLLLGKKHTAENLKEDLEADFIFSNLCVIPKSIKKLIKGQIKRGRNLKK